MDGNVNELLRRDLQIKIGREIQNSKDCRFLLRQIEKEINRVISISTVKRFFGLAKSNFAPSKYTLETFIKFLGYKDQSEYRAGYELSKYTDSEEDFWEYTKSRAKIITAQSLLSLKRKTGYDPGRFIFRSFIKERFEEFILSPETATMLVAPNGYGKSTALIQLAENYFLRGNEKFKNDILLLIDGGIFFSLFSKNYSLELLNQFIDFKFKSQQSFDIKKFPKHTKGRIFIFIDGIDEVFFDKEKYHRFLENMVRVIMACSEGSYKMIFTCQPEKIDVFIYLIKKNPMLERLWFNVNFKVENNTREAINVPLFKISEIQEIFKKNDFSRLGDIDRNDIPEIVRLPYFLSLFVNEFDEEENTNISEIQLIRKYLKRRLYSPPYFEEKMEIIRDFLELSQFGDESREVNKKQLLSKSNHNLVYEELVSDGIIYEFFIPDGLFGGNIYVKFCVDIIFEYILLEKWLENNELNVDLFIKIRNFYSKNIQLQCNLIKLLIKLVQHEEKYNILKKLTIQIKDGIIFKDSKNLLCKEPVLFLLEELELTKKLN